MTDTWNDILGELANEAYYREPAVIIFNADCLEILPRLPKVDLILCDLPYGTIACSWDVIIPFEKLWTCYSAIIRENAAVVLTASQPFTADLINSKREWFKYEWIWNKEIPANFNNAKYQPMKIHENIIVFSMKTARYNPIKTSAMPVNIRPISTKKYKAQHYGALHSNEKCDIYTRFPQSIITVNKRDGECNPLNIVHPTQKPIKLFGYLIEVYTNNGDLIVDNCLGSGTTAVASKNLGRKCIGIEIEERYCAMAVERLRQEVLL